MVLVACVWASAASAQPPQGRLFRGLFGGSNPPNPDRGQAATATLSLFEAYDTNVLSEETWGGLLDPRYQIGGAYSGLNLGLAYAANSRAVRLTAQGGGDLRYSPDSRLTMITPAGGASILVNLIDSPRATIRAQQGVSYLPYRFLSLWPRLSDAGLDAVSVPGFDFAVSTVAGYNYRSDLSFGHRLGRSSSASLDYTRTAVEYRDIGRGLIEDRLVGTFRHRLSRDTALRLGYGQRRASYPNLPETVRAHELDIGLDFNRALSLTRRTSVGFSSGAAATTPEGRLAYYLTGSATLNHEFGRSWAGQVAYYRGLQFQEGLAVPFLADAVSADLGGYLGRRVELRLAAGIAGGTNATYSAADQSRYLTHSGMARVRVALNRWWAVDVQYFHYFYQFKDATLITGGLPQALDRHGVRGGLTLWLPLVR